MNKIIIVVMVAVLSVALAITGASLFGANDFKQQPRDATEDAFEYFLPDWINWGMAEGEVKLQLEGQYKEIYGLGEGYLTTGSDADKSYEFFIHEEYSFNEKNELRQMKYVFEDFFNDEKNEYLELYNEAKKLFTETYGEWFHNIEGWIDHRYENDENMWDIAIKDGHYVAETAWKSGEYICTLYLNKNVYITYTSVTY